MDQFRKLTDRERAIIQKMVSSFQFPGSETIKKQIESANVRLIDEYHDNYGSIEFLPTYIKRVQINDTIPVSAIGKDADGVPIEFLLHLKHGVVDELEIYKADGSPIQHFPNVGGLEVEIRV